MSERGKCLCCKGPTIASEGHRCTWCRSGACTREPCEVRGTPEPKRPHTPAEWAAVTAFVNWIASNAAYNGADDEGQRFYDWGLNAWLPRQAARYFNPTREDA